MKFSNYLPKTLFGRMLSIILVPMILVQVITVFIFYERHWDTVTRHMATQLAADISLLADRTGRSPDAETIEAERRYIQEKAQRNMVEYYRRMHQTLEMQRQKHGR